MHTFAQFIGTALILAGLDAAWFSTVGLKLMGDISPLLRKNAAGNVVPLWSAGAGVYLLLAAGMVLFVRPLIERQSTAHAALIGAAFGAVVYGVYELTNRSLLNGWSWQVVAVDMLWGTFACMVGALVLQRL